MNGKNIKSLFPTLTVSGDTTSTIKGIRIDSRKITKGDLFVAIKGIHFDSHRKIKEAIKRGAMGVVVEEDVPQLPDKLMIKTDNSRKTYAFLSSAFFGFPSRKMKLVGITGTSGKTTTAYLLYRLFNKLGIKSGFIGTIGKGIGDEFVIGETFPPTTPDAFSLNEFLYRAVEKNVKYVFLEVSSFALLFHRIAGLTFYGKILTSLSKDHLDVHKTIENYVQAKASFFENYNGGVFLNSDIPFYERFKNTLAKPVLFGVKNKADYRAYIRKIQTDKIEFILRYNNEKIPFTLHMRGTFNVYNFLAAVAFAMGEGIDIGRLQEFARNIPAIPGRMNTIRRKDKIVIVDFAHNSFEVEKVLSFLKKIKARRVITVIGAVGWSTKNKREEMGKIASSLSDYVIVTTDDPRGDNPEEIASDVKRGTGENAEVILDRREAIRKAVGMMDNGDIVALLGRGEENEIHYKDKIIYLNDLKYAEKILDGN